MYHKRAKNHFSDLHHNDMALLFRGGKTSVFFPTNFVIFPLKFGNFCFSTINSTIFGEFLVTVYKKFGKKKLGVKCILWWKIIVLSHIPNLAKFVKVASKSIFGISLPIV